MLTLLLIILDGLTPSYTVKLYGPKYFTKYLWSNVRVNNSGLSVSAKA